MKTTLINILLLACALWFSACKSSNDSTAKPLSDGQNKKGTAGWPGMYQGVLPCADCQGIQTTLSLFPDNKYQISRVYLGKSEEVFRSNGAFTSDTKLNIIRLERSATEGPSSYKLQEGSLFQLDMNEKVIAGDMASRYKLVRLNTDLLDRKWILTEINGKAVQKTEGMREMPFLLLSWKDERASGFAGCNTMGGRFELGNGNRIHFSELLSTLMACPDLELENEFKQVLDRCDNFSINANTLTLNKAKMAPLARFRSE
jgi:heat shock protein HslJ